MGRAERGTPGDAERHEWLERSGGHYGGGSPRVPGAERTERHLACDGELLADISRRWFRVRDTYGLHVVREDADPA
ncbi:hypothetical protein AB0I36_31890, partial [Streptomyces sp. NPDC050659]